MALKKITLLFMLLALAGCAPRHASAQFIGYVSQQTTTSFPFNNSTCTAALAAGPTLVSNLGQDAHFAIVTGVSGVTQATYEVEASYDGTVFFSISDTGTPPTTFATDFAGVQSSGYYPVIAVKVLTCAPGAGTISIRYTGISGTLGLPVATTQIGQLDKHLLIGTASNATVALAPFRSPFGSASGTLSFQYSGAAPGPVGSTLQVQCSTVNVGGGQLIASLPPVTIPVTTQGVVQYFNVSPAACPFATVTYTTGGASTATAYLDYAFATPGLSPPAQQYTHITATTATIVKATSGFVHTLSINLGAAGTVSIFDLPPASCTGTPATNQVAIITATTTTLQTFTYDVNTLQGICVKASVAMDLTVSSQ